MPKITVINRDIEHGITGTRLDAALFNPMIFGHLSSRDEHGHQDYGWESVIAHGADPTGVADSTAAFEAADAADGLTLVPAGTYKIATNLTMDNPVLFLKGGKIVIESGIDVVMPINPGSSLDQHFDCVLGDVPALSCDVCYPEWFGIDPYNASDAIVKAIIAANNVLLSNDYTCTDGLLINKEMLTITVNGTITFDDEAASFFNVSSTNTQICGTGKIVGTDETLIIGEAGKWPFMTIDNVDGLTGELSDIASDIGGLDGRVDALEAQFVSGNISVDVTSTYFSTPVNSTWVYKKNITTGDVSILIPDAFGIHGTNAELKFTPNGGSWPAAIIPATALTIGGVYLASQGVSSKFRMGKLTIPNNVATVIAAAFPNDTGDMSESGFGTGTAESKGIFRQTINYRV